MSGQLEMELYKNLFSGGQSSLLPRQDKLSRNINKKLKKGLTNDKTCGIMTRLIQISEKLKQFKQFSDSSLTKFFEKM